MPSHMQIVLVLIARRAIGKKQGLTDFHCSQIVRGIWRNIMQIQESPTLVKLLDMRTPEVIPI